MAQGRKKNNFVPRTCVSPLWKDSTSSNAFKPPRMHMRPPQAPLTSLDTFMAAHSPRRFCQARQKYLLKPLTVDKRITDTGYVRVQQKTRNDSSDARCNTVHHRQSHRRATHSNTYATTDSSSEGEVNSQRVVALGKCELQNEDLVASDASSELYRSSFFRPGPKIPMTFNRSTSIPTLMHPGTTDLIAIGTIPITSQRQTPVKPMSRSSSEEDIQLMPKTKTGALWKTKATLNLKGCKYPDPMIGASPAFQARITEMAQMEVETIKFEKTKKTRKKTSSS